MLCLILVSVLAMCCCQQTFSVTGWKMTDRFYGFRFELYGSDFDKSIQEIVQLHADEKGCFGWIQETKAKTQVGEVRCSKQRGQDFLEWLKQLTQVTKVDYLEYTDTKIRLHYSHFKILEATKQTCFLDKPHQCVDVAKDNQQNIGSQSSSMRNEF
jgi:hypothetical protein